MSYPINTVSVLIYSGYIVDIDFITIIQTNVVLLDWYHADPKPTEQEIIDTGNTADYNRWVKVNELEKQRTTYTANEIASDPQSSEVITQENEWVEGQTIQLLKMTDVQAIKDFDTTKPVTLVIANNVLGRRYYEQGLKLQNQNDAAISAGQPEEWDQPKLSSFITVNKIAADDITAVTAPANPDFALRQGTVTPSDRTSKILIYRSTRQYDNRPSPDPSLEMVLTKKDNGRALYAFLYLQTGTYLEWVQFIDQGDGTWRANSSVNTISWVNSDLDIVMSYSTNPAVQQDWFTDKLAFDAGGDQILRRVRWDAEDIGTRQGQGGGRGRGRG